jgi:hypothetical protein
MADEIVLTDELLGSLRGRALPYPYRAVLHDSPFGGKPAIKVEQQFEDGSTLMERPSDAISIDFGQGWSIDSGMFDAIMLAAAIIKEREAA